MMKAENSIVNSWIKIFRSVPVLLSIIYNLARIDEKTGNQEAALEKFKQVASEGNKLWIAQKASERITNVK